MLFDFGVIRKGVSAKKLTSFANVNKLALKTQLQECSTVAHFFNLQKIYYI